MRVRTAFFAAALLAVVGSGLASAAADRRDFRAGHGHLRGRASGRHRDRRRAGTAAAAHRGRVRPGHVSRRRVADWHLLGHIRTARVPDAGTTGRGVTIGFRAQINAALELSSVQETVTVTGESPIIDTLGDGHQEHVRSGDPSEHSFRT